MRRQSTFFRKKRRRVSSLRNAPDVSPEVVRNLAESALKTWKPEVHRDNVFVDYVSVCEEYSGLQPVNGRWCQWYRELFCSSGYQKRPREPPGFESRLSETDNHFTREAILILKHHGTTNSDIIVSDCIFIKKLSENEVQRTIREVAHLDYISSLLVPFVLVPAYKIIKHEEELFLAAPLFPIQQCAQPIAVGNGQVVKEEGVHEICIALAEVLDLPVDMVFRSITAYYGADGYFWISSVSFFKKQNASPPPPPPPTIISRNTPLKWGVNVLREAAKFFPVQEIENIEIPMNTYDGLKLLYNSAYYRDGVGFDCAMRGGNNYLLSTENDSIQRTSVSTISLFDMKRQAVDRLSDVVHTLFSCPGDFPHTMLTLLHSFLLGEDFLCPLWNIIVLLQQSHNSEGHAGLENASALVATAILSSGAKKLFREIMGESKNQEWSKTRTFQSIDSIIASIKHSPEIIISSLVHTAVFRQLEFAEKLVDCADRLSVYLHLCNEEGIEVKNKKCVGIESVARPRRFTMSWNEGIGTPFITTMCQCLKTVRHRDLASLVRATLPAIGSELLKDRLVEQFRPPSPFTEFPEGRLACCIAADSGLKFLYSMDYSRLNSEKSNQCLLTITNIAKHYASVDICVVSCCHQLAYLQEKLAMLCSDPEERINHLHKAISYFEQVEPPPPAVAVLHSTLAETLLRMGRVTEAEQSFLDVIVSISWESEPSPQKRSCAINNYAMVHYSKTSISDKMKAIPLFESALLLCDNIDEQCTIMNNIGSVYYKAGMYKKALQCFIGVREECNDEDLLICQKHIQLCNNKMRISASIYIQKHFRGWRSRHGGSSKMICTPAASTVSCLIILVLHTTLSDVSYNSFFLNTCLTKVQCVGRGYACRKLLNLRHHLSQKSAARTELELDATYLLKIFSKMELEIENEKIDISGSMFREWVRRYSQRCVALWQDKKIKTKKSTYTWWNEWINMLVERPGGSIGFGDFQESLYRFCIERADDVVNSHRSIDPALCGQSSDIYFIALDGVIFSFCPPTLPRDMLHSVSEYISSKALVITLPVVSFIYKGYSILACPAVPLSDDSKMTEKRIGITVNTLDGFALCFPEPASNVDIRRRKRSLSISYVLVDLLKVIVQNIVSPDTFTNTTEIPPPLHIVLGYIDALDSAELLDSLNSCSKLRFENASKTVSLTHSDSDLKQQTTSIIKEVGKQLGINQVVPIKGGAVWLSFTDAYDIPALSWNGGIPPGTELPKDLQSVDYSTLLMQFVPPVDVYCENLNLSKRYRLSKALQSRDRGIHDNRPNAEFNFIFTAVNFARAVLDEGYLATGNLRRSVRLLSSASTLVPTMYESNQLCVLLFWTRERAITDALALCYSVVSQYKLAFLASARSVRLSQSHGSNFDISTTTATHGIILMKLSRYPESEKSLNESLNHADDSQRPQAFVNLALYTLNKTTRDTTKSLEYLYEALTASQHLNSNVNQTTADIVEKIASLEHETDKWNAAEASYESLLSMYEVLFGVWHSKYRLITQVLERCSSKGQHRAAIIIQATWKGFSARTMYRKKSFIKDDNMITSRVTSVVKGYLSRRELYTKYILFHNAIIQRVGIGYHDRLCIAIKSSAVTIVQKVSRGLTDRRNLSTLKNMLLVDSNKLACSVAVVQSVVSGYQSRLLVYQMLVIKHNGTLHRMLKGYSSRKELFCLRLSKAVGLIQSVIRAYLGRLLLYKKYQQQHLQKIALGYKHRKNLYTMKLFCFNEEQQKATAVLIAVLLGYKSRRNLCQKRLVKSITTIQSSLIGFFTRAKLYHSHVEMKRSIIARCLISFTVRRSMATLYYKNKIISSILVIQRTGRSFLANTQTQIVNKYSQQANTLQRVGRGYRCRFIKLTQMYLCVESVHRKIEQNAMQQRHARKRSFFMGLSIIQKVGRGYLFRLKEFTIRERLNDVVYELQSTGRGMECRRQLSHKHFQWSHAIRLLQKTGKGMCTRCRIERIQGAYKGFASKYLQRIGRALFSRQMLNKKRFSMSFLQAIGKGYLSRSGIFYLRCSVALKTLHRMFAGTRSRLKCFTDYTSRLTLNKLVTTTALGLHSRLQLRYKLHSCVCKLQSLTASFMIRRRLGYLYQWVRLSSVIRESELSERDEFYLQFESQLKKKTLIHESVVSAVIAITIHGYICMEESEEMAIEEDDYSRKKTRALYAIPSPPATSPCGDSEAELTRKIERILSRERDRQSCFHNKLQLMEFAQAVCAGATLVAVLAVHSTEGFVGRLRSCSFPAPLSPPPPWSLNFGKLLSWESGALQPSPPLSRKSSETVIRRTIIPNQPSCSGPVSPLPPCAVRQRSGSLLSDSSSSTAIWRDIFESSLKLDKQLTERINAGEKKLILMTRQRENRFLLESSREILGLSCEGLIPKKPSITPPTGRQSRTR